MQSRTNGRVKLPITINSQKSIISLYRSRLDRYNFAEMRQRLLTIDKLIQLEENSTRPSRKEHGYLADTQPPVIRPEIETAHAYYVDMFCSGDPMFKVIEHNSNADAAKMMQAQVTADQLYFGYSREISMFLLDGQKYNFAALEIDWVREQTYQPTSDATYSRNDQNKSTAEVYTGNKIKRADPYNTFVDKSVPYNEVARRGQFAGYIERMPMTELHEMLTSLRTANSVVLNESRAMWESKPTKRTYYVPEVDGTVNSGDSGWGDFFFPGARKGDVESNEKHAVAYSEHYEVTTLYMRIIPSMHSINVASKDVVQIWKFIIVNHEYIVLAERQTNAHNLLPLTVSQPDDSGVWSGSKSLAEALVPYQNLSTEMNDAFLGLVYKAVGDKGIYDSRRIAKRDIESKKPDAKIPARPSANSNDLRGAYMPMPYDANAGSIIQQGLGYIKAQTNDISGQNNADRGQFQKGNKTMFEYQDVMSNSDSRKYVKAMLMESSVFQPLKNMMRLNILQFSKSGSTVANGQEVQINPATMRAASLQFRIADGLKNVERIAKTGELMNMFQMAVPMMQLAPAYNVDPFMIWMDIMRNRGYNLDDYKPQNMDPKLLPGAKQDVPAEEPAGGGTGPTQ